MGNMGSGIPALHVCPKLVFHVLAMVGQSERGPKRFWNLAAEQFRLFLLAHEGLGFGVWGAAHPPQS